MTDAYSILIVLVLSCVAVTACSGSQVSSDGGLSQSGTVSTDGDAPAELRVSKLAAYSSVVCVLLTDDSVRCWGSIEELPATPRSGSVRVPTAVDLPPAADLTVFPTRPGPLPSVTVCVLTKAHREVVCMEKRNGSTWSLELENDVCALGSAGRHHICFEGCDGVFRCTEGAWLRDGVEPQWTGTQEPTYLDGQFCWVDNGSVACSQRSVAQPGQPLEAVESVEGQLCGQTESGGYICLTSKGWEPIGDVTNVVQMTGRHGTWCALREDGQAYCWGRNRYDCAGAPESMPVPSTDPVRVPLDDVTSIVTTGSETCAVNATGRAYCWGFAEFSGLGAGISFQNQGPYQVKPEMKWTWVTVGGSGTCALSEEREAWCWGWYEPPGDVPLRYEAPRRAPQLDGADALARVNDWWCSLRSDRLSCQQTESEEVFQEDGVADIKSDWILCVELTSGGLKCYRSPGERIALSPDFERRTLDEIEIYHRELCYQDDARFQCFSSLSEAPFGFHHADATLIGGHLAREKDTLFYWPSGVLDVEDGDFGTAEIDPSLNVTQTAVGSEYQCLLDDAGNLYCRCLHDDCESLPGNIENSPRLQRVELPPIVSLEGGANHACAIDKDGGLWCWGYAGEGALGNGVSPYQHLPVQVDLSP